jgi:hypothetical protein
LITVVVIKYIQQCSSYKEYFSGNPHSARVVPASTQLLSREEASRITGARAIFPLNYYFYKPLTAKQPSEAKWYSSTTTTTTNYHIQQQVQKQKPPSSERPFFEPLFGMNDYQVAGTTTNDKRSIIIPEGFKVYEAVPTINN